MKEYLNVGDVLKIPSSTGDDGSVGSVIGCDGNMIAQCCEDISMSMMSNRFRNDLRNERAMIISHAINSHDELVAEVERLRMQLQYAFMAGWEEGVNGMECNEAEIASVEIANQFSMA